MSQTKSQPRTLTSQRRIRTQLMRRVLAIRARKTTTGTHPQPIEIEPELSGWVSRITAESSRGLQEIAG